VITRGLPAGRGSGSVSDGVSNVANAVKWNAISNVKLSRSRFGLVFVAGEHKTEWNFDHMETNLTRTIFRGVHMAWLFFGLVLAGAGNLSGDERNPVKRVDVFAAGADGYHTYRIPAVVVSPGGTLLAFCEGRKTSRSDHGDIDLVLKRSIDGGKSWGPLELVHEEGGTAKTTIGNPCPVIDDATKTIWLPFCRDNDGVFITRSTDDGKTWSKPVDITAHVKKSNWGWYATGPGVGIQMQSGPHRGRLVIPCDHREKINGEDIMFSHVFYSDDHGQSWKLGGSVDKHTDECQVAELTDGRLIINMRNYWGRTGKAADRAGMRAVSFSTDGGETWSPLEFQSALVEPVCQASLLRLDEKSAGADARLLFSNPASSTARRNLTIRLSEDGGRTWPIARVLHAGPSAYSCLTILADGTIGCLFEAGRANAYEKIVFSQFPADWIVPK
jgi:sialidase-1